MTTDVGTLRTEEPASAAARSPGRRSATWSPRRLAVIAGLVVVVVFVVPVGARQLLAARDDRAR